MYETGDSENMNLFMLDDFAKITGFLLQILAISSIGHFVHIFLFDKKKSTRKTNYLTEVNKQMSSGVSANQHQKTKRFRLQLIWVMMHHILFEMNTEKKCSGAERVPISYHGVLLLDEFNGKKNLCRTVQKRFNIQ